MQWNENAEDVIVANCIGSTHCRRQVANCAGAGSEFEFFRCESIELIDGGVAAV